jgi:hypothetical protein
MAKVCFTLSMPNVGSWDNKWSSAHKLFARVVDFGRGKVGDEKAREVAAKGSYHYNFGDGWCARVSASIVDGKEAAKIRKASQGFCGYDWMIDSIRKHGKIQVD